MKKKISALILLALAGNLITLPAAAEESAAVAEVEIIIEEETDSGEETGSGTEIETDSLTADDSTSTVTGYILYDEILQKYLTAMDEGWDYDDYMENDLCYLAGYLSSTDEIGYYMTDLDEDGVDELLIGEVNDENLYYVGFFYNLYTIKEGERIQAAVSAERSRFYLCNDGLIAYEGSSSAFCSSNGYYYFTGTGLELREAVLYDSEYDSENPYFYSNTAVWEDYSTPISESEAFAVMDSYEYMAISFTALSEISDGLDREESVELSVLRQQAEAEVEAARMEAEEIEEILSSAQISQLEMNEYSYQMYQIWDNALNTLWGYLSQSLPEEEMSALTEEELIWIEEKESAIEAAGAEYEGGSMQPLIQNTKGAELTKERVYVLLEMIS